MSCESHLRSAAGCSCDTVQQRHRNYTQQLQEAMRQIGKQVEFEAADRTQSKAAVRQRQQLRTHICSIAIADLPYEKAVLRLQCDAGDQPHFSALHTLSHVAENLVEEEVEAADKERERIATELSRIMCCNEHVMVCPAHWTCATHMPCGPANKYFCAVFLARSRREVWSEGPCNCTHPHCSSWPILHAIQNLFTVTSCVASRLRRHSILKASCE